MDVKELETLGKSQPTLSPRDPRMQIHRAERYQTIHNSTYIRAMTNTSVRCPLLGLFRLDDLAILCQFTPVPFSPPLHTLIQTDNGFITQQPP